MDRRASSPRQRRSFVVTEAEYLASITGVMEKEVSAEVVQVVLDAIAAAGQETAPHGSSEIVEKLTRECPDCEGSLGGGGGNTDEPSWTCTTCVWGRDHFLTARQRELLILVLDDLPAGVPLLDAEQTAALVDAHARLKMTVRPAYCSKCQCRTEGFVTDDDRPLCEGCRSELQS
jgi:hypothetical protein